MKILFENYTFNAASKQITFNTSSSVLLDRVLVITNVTRNIIIYNFADPSAGGSITNNVLTLTYNTTSMSNNDVLQIFLDNALTPASDEMIAVLQEQNDHMLRIIKLLEPSGRQNPNGMQMVDVAASSGAILSQQYFSYFGAIGQTISTAESTFNLQSRIAYLALRNNLEFS